MAFRVRGTTLPDRTDRTLVIDGDQVYVDEHSSAELICDGGWILPGLVDAHSHPGSVQPNTEYSEDNLRRDLTIHRDAGVLLVRAPGSPERLPPWVDKDEELPRVMSAGHWLIQPGTFYRGGGREVTYDQLVAAAVEEAEASSGWCKIVGDWMPYDPAVPLDVLTEVVNEVHAMGGRVAVHAQTALGCRNAVLAGADSLEHGMHLEWELLDRMAEQGTAFVPTFTEFSQVPAVAATLQRGEVRDWIESGWAGLGPTALAAHEAGVTVLAGTDSVPFGNIVTEVGWLLRAGLPAEVAVGAASWTARDWLGLPGRIHTGVPADLVVYEEDPVANPGVLTVPKRIILKGRVVI